MYIKHHLCISIFIVMTQYLSSNGELFMGFQANGALVPVCIVKFDAHSSLSNACLAMFVYQILQTAGTHLKQ